MAADTTDDSVPSASGTESQAAFREERDRIILANPIFSLAFSTANGTLVSLFHHQTQTELIGPAEAAAEGYLWRLELATEDGDTLTLSSRDCREFTQNVGYHRHQGNLRVWLQWSGFHVGATSMEGRLTAQITFPANAPAALFHAEIELPNHLSVRSLTFPCLCALGPPDPIAEEALFLPLSGGVLIPNPRGAAAQSRAAHLGQDHGWRAVYPGPASLQLFGYSCGNRATAWLAPGDPAGALKTMAASSMPHSDRLSLAVTHHPTRRPDGLWSHGYPTALGLAFGDWFEAAREYRAWAIQQSWCARGRGGERRLPALTSSYGLWTSHWGGARSSVAAARELQRLVNVPIKLDWRCWHRCARAGAYPDYFPPRGGDDAFALARQQFAEAGILTQLGLSGLAASPDSEAWKAEQAGRYSLLPSPHEPFTSSPAPAGSALIPMCPSTRYWRQKLAALAREAVKRGADGLYLEDIAASRPLLCRDSDHGHGPPEPTQWAAGVRASLAAVRSAVGEETHLAADGPAEIYLDLLDAFISPQPAADREALFPDNFGPGCSPIPLFSAVYHDYATLSGPDVSLVNHRPHDPLWPAGAIADLRSPAPLMSRDYQAQFCFEVARAAAWGHHPVLANFSPDQARDENNRRKLAFLAAVLRAQAWGVGALIPYAEFMGPLTIDSPPIEADFLINPSGAALDDRRAMRRSIHPILGSAWRAPGSALALLLANIHHQPADFTARLRSSRLSLQLPLRLSGRTFSEDGDVPAASLRASGTEISGRLPGRCVVLVSLR